MKNILIIILLLSSTFAYSQRSSLKGVLLDENGEALMYATAVLLNPADSTMAYYGISDKNGLFVIKNVKEGSYILQTGFMGYQSFFRNIDHPIPGNDLGNIAMLPQVNTLDEVKITANRIPMLIKQDTVEYLASAFKTKIGASAEELLKKLPGIEVDRAGNIKAQGENVTRVLVDGKEFFSSDPTIATKNLPADAIKSVQVYNKKSDETELSGIEDGSYSKTINMILKDGKKSAMFGEVTAGAGNDERYQAGAKLFRFTKKNQFAALGMINNINKSGFSFQDYLDFQGGLQSMMSGGGGSAHRGLSDDVNSPVDFGQSVNGLVSSAAAGLNFTHEAKLNKRFNISYLGNGSNRSLEKSTYTQYYSPNFTTNSDVEQDTKNRTHRLNYTWRNRIDPSQNLTMFGGLSLTNGSSNKSLLTESFADDVLMNNLYSTSADESNGLSANTRATYLKTGKGSLKLFKVYASINYTKSLAEAEWNDITRYLSSNELFIKDRFQEDDSKTLTYSANSSLTFKIGKMLYLVPSIIVGAKDETLVRLHTLDGVNNTDLSPDFNNQHLYVKGGLAFNHNTKRTQFELSGQIQTTTLKNSLKNSSFSEDENYLYFLPRLSWQYEYSSGKRLSFNYNTSINAPSSRQLLPVQNTSNALQIYEGNNKLTPEYRHNARFSWLMFDQFSSTSIFASINGNYTRNKIVLSRTIDDDFAQKINLINAGEDYRVSGNFDFTTPIRKLGIDVNVRISESWNRGMSLVNDVENISTNFSHTISLYINNRKKDKWDLMIGGRIQITDAKYSLPETPNNHYVNISAYGDLSYTPNDKWYFSFSSDITRYSEQSFGNAVNIPILRAEISHYFLKRRASLTLSGHDLLDKNKGIERISQMNYLRESVSNVLGRYFMLTLKFRINKFDNQSAGMKINFKRRRR